jgi:hypothetical protein
MFGRHSRWAIGVYVFGFIAAGSSPSGVVKRLL